MSVEDNLRGLGLELPEPPQPVGAYVPAVARDGLVFISGVLPLMNGKPIFRGKVGLQVTLDQGYDAAAVACLNALAILKKELGSLDRVKRIIKVTGYIACSAFFQDQPKVLNGASELLLKLFGEKGRHARVAIGCISLPMDAPVEIEMIVEVEEDR